MACTLCMLKVYAPYLCILINMQKKHVWLPWQCDKVSSSTTKAQLVCSGNAHSCSIDTLISQVVSPGPLKCPGITGCLLLVQCSKRTKHAVNARWTCGNAVICSGSSVILLRGPQPPWRTFFPCKNFMKKLYQFSKFPCKFTEIPLILQCQWECTLVWQGLYHRKIHQKICKYMHNSLFDSKGYFN